ncbi:MAG: site-specific DNA-methyltransferase [Candidatus Freyrarchaeum guaymaensis]
MEKVEKVLEGDCLKYFSEGSIKNIHLTFLDPPYRQGKDYKFFDDNQPEEKYWNWLREILLNIHEVTVDGGAIYFMHREKNVKWMMDILEKTGWTFQNLIIWKKFTSAVPCDFRFGKQYQVIVFATKGKKPRVFNKLRVDYPLRPHQKQRRLSGVYVTDVWDDIEEFNGKEVTDFWEDIRELTSGYFAGDEAIRNKSGERVHLQQSPVALLLRIVLTSTMPGDLVLDPLAGTGTTLVVAKQLGRNFIGIEVDPEYVKIIKKRLNTLRSADNISKYYSYYRFTPNLEKIWKLEAAVQRRLFDE